MGPPISGLWAGRPTPMIGHVSRTLTVLFDADCGVCRMTARALERLDWLGRLDLVPLQAFHATPPATTPSDAELQAALHVRDAGGACSRGGAAALRIASAVPVLAPLSLVGRVPGGIWAAERGYRLIADHRHRISRALRLDRCAIELRVTSPARGRDA